MAEQLNDVNLEKFKELDRTVRENPALGRCTVKVKSTWHRGTKVLVEVGPMHALGDNLFPPYLSEDVRKALEFHGKDVRLVNIEEDYGHDFFLIPEIILDKLSPPIREFLDT